MQSLPRQSMMTNLKTKRPRCKECKQQFTQYNSLTLVCSVKCAIEYARKDAAKAQRKIDRINAKAEKERKAKARKEKRDFDNKDMRKLPSKAQYWCNKYIRLRDAGKGCKSCGTKKPDIQYCAGHFIPVGRCIALRYDERNIHLQCNSYCNMHLSGNLTAYEAALRRDLGDEVVEWLKGPHEPVRYRAEDYLRIIEEYKAKIKQLGK